MAKEYKVWIEVETIDLDWELGGEECEGDPNPKPAGVFATEEEARALQRRLADLANQ